MRHLNFDLKAALSKSFLLNFVLCGQICDALNGTSGLAVSSVTSELKTPWFDSYVFLSRTDGHF